MKQRYRLFKRGSVFYSMDTETGQQLSLKTRDKVEALRLLHFKNEAHLQPTLNLQIARIYVSAADPEARTRTWRDVMNAIVSTKTGTTHERWTTAVADSALDVIRGQLVLETRPEQLLKSIQSGTVSTNTYLRRIHNFACDMGWLPWPLLKQKQWPKIRHRDRRGITWDEHQRIVGIEWLPERKAFYELLWHLGGSQSDVASLRAEDIQWEDQVVSYSRRKTGRSALLRFSRSVAEIFKSLPQSGLLFPRISQMHEKHRAAEFKRRCRRVGIEGVSLHSYRYAWAERARRSGVPERFAQEALGHASAAVHRAYAKQAQVTVPSLEDYEGAQRGKILGAVFTASPVEQAVES